ncbi:MAG: peroxiredoxin [Defluviitaleaceae bacterium]|nr:peroxiredoxin [Defluviitaleaceae bacterium]
MLTAGIKAPHFVLTDQHGHAVNLADFLGERVVLCFFDKYTDLACSFRDVFAEFKARGVVVLGITTDDVTANREFAYQHRLPFKLLADTNWAAITAYDVWKKKAAPNRQSWGVSRAIFVIDQEGIIRKVFEKPRAFACAQYVLSELKF